MVIALFAEAANVWEGPVIIAAAYAAAGGFAANLLPLLDLRTLKPAERPDLRSVFYWIPFMIMPILGAGLAMAYVQSGVELKPIVAVNIGITAPLILRAMASSPPAVKPPDLTGLPIKPGA